MQREQRSTTRLRAKLLSAIAIFAVVISGSVTAKDVEFERGSDRAQAAASQAVHVQLNTSGISCSVDSAYGPEFLWTRWYQNAVLTIDLNGASSLVLFDEDGDRDDSCTVESAVRFRGAVDVEFSQTADGSQYVVRTSGRSMGLAQMTAREMIARIVGSTGAITVR